jgi:hypothetical protein
MQQGLQLFNTIFFSMFYRKISGFLAVPARIIWTRFCNSSRLSQSIGLAGFEG